jgi:hypothetical protein
VRGLTSEIGETMKCLNTRDCVFEVKIGKNVTEFDSHYIVCVK